MNELYSSAHLLHLNYQNLRYSKLPQKKRYIGFWVRFGAGVADTILLIIIGFVVGFILQIILYDTNFGPGSDYIIGIIISWSYFCLMQSSKHQATMGMKMCKIKIRTKIKIKSKMKIYFHKIRKITKIYFLKIKKNYTYKLQYLLIIKYTYFKKYINLERNQFILI